MLNQITCPVEIIIERHMFKTTIYYPYYSSLLDSDSLSFVSDSESITSLDGGDTGERTFHKA